ncbi:MAG TPA: DUF1570 domain-containing protein [Pirellulaceae bacterium]|nr:DUF1570 domain-containing protein [Pirellulaceae bacterium]
MMEQSSIRTSAKHMPSTFLSCIIVLVTGMLSAGLAPHIFADELVLTRDGVQKTVVGETVVEAQDGGIMFRGTNGRVWVLQKDEYDQLVATDQPFQPLDKQSIGKEIIAELPHGFEVLLTNNYVLVYNTSQTYAKWVGGLYERLYSGFENFWKTKGIQLKPPDVPLCVLLFDSKENYNRYAQQDLGQGPGTMVAYYNLVTNRVATYDLTGLQTTRLRDLRSSDQINALLAQPASEALVATMVHEAVHQIMFNRGMQQRFADTPLWVNEGMAVYFETPDLANRSGWRSMGKINYSRLARFRSNLARRPENSLNTLLADDTRFRDSAQALDAYAEAWALNFYLLKQHQKKFVEYLNELAGKKPLRTDTPQERIELFESYFGELDKLDKKFLDFVVKLK